MQCKICYNQEKNKIYYLKEMMFGYNDIFTYFKCSRCGCLQIEKIPKNLSKYYPSNYYSYSQSLNNPILKTIMNFLKKIRDTYAVFNTGFINKLLFNKFPNFALRSLSEINVNKNF